MDKIEFLTYRENILDKPEFLVYWLNNASQESVYNWLQKNQRNKPSIATRNESIEKALLKRNKPLINLGLGLFGHDPETGFKLYKDGDNTIKKAALSGTTVAKFASYSWVLNYRVLHYLLKKQNLELLTCYLKNPFIHDIILCELYKKEGLFKEISDEFWYLLIRATYGNERLTTTYIDSRDYDLGMFGLDPIEVIDEVFYNKVIASAWKLFERIPVNKNNALWLSRFTNCFCSLPRKLGDLPIHDMDIREVIKRWDIADEKDDLSYSEYFRNPYARCRYNLAYLIDVSSEFESLKNDKDLSLRQSYYTRFITTKPHDIKKLFNKDNTDFLDAALDNKSLYRYIFVRDQLKFFCYKSIEDFNNIYWIKFCNTSRLLANEHSDWFADIEEKTSKTEEQMILINEKLERIESHQLTSIEP